jgi:hypothetical protein
VCTVGERGKSSSLVRKTQLLILYFHLFNFLQTCFGFRIMKFNEMHYFSNLFAKVLYMFRSCPMLYVVIMKFNEMHYFSNLFDKVLSMFSLKSTVHHQECLNTVYTETGICHACSVVVCQRGPDHASRQLTELT